MARPEEQASEYRRRWLTVQRGRADTMAGRGVTACGKDEGSQPFTGVHTTAENLFLAFEI